jgi:ABC-2 type transport system ATP-binding protein
LTRYFGGKCAVDQVTLNIPRGSVFGMLGRNGSGKTTIIRMLLGLLEPTRGSASILGEDCQKLSPATRAKVGYVAEGHPLIDWMRVRDLESFQKGSYPQWNARTFKAIVDHFGLESKSRASQLSRGQRAGLSLALVLATDPELLIMDDPAMGLDPVARRTFLEAMILLTRDAGHTIIFSSHILDDVERVADHIAILDRSVLRVSASVETFRSRIKRLVLTFACDAPKLPPIPGLLLARRERNELQLTLANMNPETEQLLHSLGAISTNEVAISLEEAAIAYLGERGERPTLLQATEPTGVTP